MISTGSFLTETGASNKQSELVKKLTAAWEKKNSKTARAGGASLMALSLAACGGEDDTPFAQADIDAAVTAAVAAAEAPLNEAITAAETAQAAAEADAAAALVAQAAAEADAAAALVAQAAAEADAAAATAAKETAEAAQAAAEADAATATAAKEAAEAAQATAEASLATAQADLTAKTAEYDALVASNATLQSQYDALIAPAAVSLESLNAETLAGTAGNDTFTGTATYYDAADNVVDGSTADDDTYNLTVTASNASADNTFAAAGGGNDAGTDVEIAPNVTNVENVNMTIQSVAAMEVSAVNMTGVSNLTVTRADLDVGGTAISGNKTVVPLYSTVNEYCINNSAAEPQA